MNFEVRNSFDNPRNSNPNIFVALYGFKIKSYAKDRKTGTVQFNKNSKKKVKNLCLTVGA